LGAPVTVQLNASDAPAPTLDAVGLTVTVTLGAPDPGSTYRHKPATQLPETMMVLVPSELTATRLAPLLMPGTTGISVQDVPFSRLADCSAGGQDPFVAHPSWAYSVVDDAYTALAGPVLTCVHVWP